MSSHSFQIKKMNRHEDGFHVATVLSNVNQQVYVIHDRWGSWMVSDPDDRKFLGAREPQSLGIAPEYLQDYRKRHQNKMTVWMKPIHMRKGSTVAVKKPKGENPMARRHQISDEVQKKNPMLAQGSVNRMVAAKLATENNPFVKKKKNPMVAKAKVNPMLKRKK